MRNSQNRIVSKKNILIFAFIVNLAALVTLSFFNFFWIYAVVGGVGVIVMSFFVANNNFVTHKMSTLLVIFAFPLFAILLYVFTKSKARWLFGRRTWRKLNYASSDYVVVEEEPFETLKKYDYNAYKISKFYANYFNAPLYQNTSVRYISGAKKYYEEVFEELLDAKKYILIDAYKIREGDTWDRLFEVLKQKAREGVEIKILYNPKTNKDSFTDKFTFKKLENYKIEVEPFRSSLYGFASHRKLFVIDGIVAFVGGANIYDDQSVVTAEFGNWRQSGVKLTGDAVWNLSVLFLNSWRFAKDKVDTDYIKYKPEQLPKAKSNEFVQPLSISPLSNRNEVRDMYLNLINNAKTNITIMSSCYLIDSHIFSALSNAVKGGVDVSIIASNNTDRYNRNILGRGYYESLIRAGVKIYEYGGAVRSKVVSVDGVTALIGGANVDIGKLESCFDCSVLIHSREVLKEIDKEQKKIMEESRLLAVKDLKDDSFKDKFRGKVYRFFSM